MLTYLAGMKSIDMLRGPNVLVNSGTRSKYYASKNGWSDG